jgi:NADH dehydrogenase
VPDVTRPGELCSPSAQHAVRQARRLDYNIVAAMRGRETKPYEHSYAGSVASLGIYQGVAQIYGIKLRGFPAWFCTDLPHEPVPAVAQGRRLAD